jgi:hypothetical protein
MNDQTLIILASIPIILVVISWGIIYRRAILHIRFMALSAGIGIFLGLLVVNVVTGSLIVSIFEIVGLAALFGASFLLWWPILGKSLRRHTKVRW